MALGDSTGLGVGATEGGGYPERLGRLLPALRLQNLCESGATTADVLADQVPEALRTRPRLITLGAGINDVGLQLPDDAFAVNLEEIVVRLRKLGAPIAIANIPDLALAPAVARLATRSLYEKRIEMFNLHVEATASQRACFTGSADLSQHLLFGLLFVVCQNLADPLFVPSRWKLSLLHACLLRFRRR